MFMSRAVAAIKHTEVESSVIFSGIFERFGGLGGVSMQLFRHVESVFLRAGMFSSPDLFAEQQALKQHLDIYVWKLNGNTLFCGQVSLLFHRNVIWL